MRILAVINTGSAYLSCAGGSGSSLQPHHRIHTDPKPSLVCTESEIPDDPPNINFNKTSTQHRAAYIKPYNPLTPTPESGRAGSHSVRSPASRQAGAAGDAGPTCGVTPPGRRRSATCAPPGPRGAATAPLSEPGAPESGRPEAPRSSAAEGAPGCGRAATRPQLLPGAAGTPGRLHRLRTALLLPFLLAVPPSQKRPVRPRPTFTCFAPVNAISRGSCRSPREDLGGPVGHGWPNGPRHQRPSSALIECTATENNTFIPLMYHTTDRIKMNMPVKRFILDRKQPRRPLLQIKGITLKSFLIPYK